MAEATAVGGELLPVIRFNNLRHAALASLYLGLSFTWLPYPLVVLPSEVREFYPTDFNTFIGYATGIGAIFAITVPPIVGAWSDRITTRFGRRRPFMVAGVLLGIVGLMVMMTAHSYTQFVIGHVIAQLFLNGAAAAYYAIIPDIVPDAEFGKASGFLAGMQQGGALLGFVLTFLFSTIHQVRLSLLVMAAGVRPAPAPGPWSRTPAPVRRPADGKAHPSNPPHAPHTIAPSPFTTTRDRAAA